VKLRWKSFERKLRPRIRRAIRASPTLKKEYKQIRNTFHRHRHFRGWMARLLVLAVVGGLIAFRPGSAPLVFAFLLLWSLGSICWRAVRLHLLLYASPDLNTFRYLPVSDDDIFRALWRAFIFNSAWSALDFAVAYGALAFQLGNGWQSLLTGAAFGALQCIFVLASAVLLASFGSQRWLTLLAMMFYGGAIGLVILGGRVPQLVTALISLAYWIPPSGWIYHAIGIGASGGWLLDFFPSILTAFVLVALPLAYRRKRAGYSLSEGIFDKAYRSTAIGEAAALKLKDYGDLFVQDESAAAASVRSQLLHDRLDWAHSGFVERLIGCSLTDREKTVAEFLTGSNPKWTKSLLSLIVFLAFLSLGAAVVARVIRAPTDIFIFIIVFLVVASAKPWPAFRPTAPIGHSPPHYALYPIGFGELMRTLLKISFLRYFFCAPFVFLFIIIAGLSLRTEYNFSWVLGLKLVFLGAAAQPIIAVATFSTASSDTHRIAFLFVAGVFATSLVCLGVIFLAFLTPLNSLISGSAILLLSLACPWLYGLWFNRSKFDLIHPRATGAVVVQPAR
jgi:hypothetical protein